MRKQEERDYVDHVIDQWNRVRPDLDVSPMGVIGRLSRLSRIFERRIEEVYAQHGLQGGRFSVLAALRRAGPPYRLSPTELYNSLLITSATLTNRLDRLTEAGLIERIPDPKDRRYLLVALTQRGLRAVDEALEDHLANEHRLLAPLTATERLILAELLRKLLIAYEDLPERAEPFPRRPAAERRVRPVEGEARAGP